MKREGKNCGSECHIKDTFSKRSANRGCGRRSSHGWILNRQHGFPPYLRNRTKLFIKDVSNFPVFRRDTCVQTLCRGGRIIVSEFLPLRVQLASLPIRRNWIKKIQRRGVEFVHIRWWRWRSTAILCTEECRHRRGIREWIPIVLVGESWWRAGTPYPSTRCRPEMFVSPTPRHPVPLR